MWFSYFVAFLMLKVVRAAVILPDRMESNSQEYIENIRNNNFTASQCKPLSKCLELVWLLKNKENVSTLEPDQILDYIKGIQCGFEVNEPKIICPEFGEAIEDDGINFNSSNRIVIGTLDAVSP